ncbi:MAG: mannose-1-phosphate guanylyltransferase/mannose-6-phosphate isomerase [Gammaproteobacteria bacterium]|nr:mannose-1-phosphate guanylyltransferase/mannose-6-phosphate isomerase [Gammaproteobacteria bacterium]MBT4145753.1 mannose-1-phosphate guanylyltransferase/mannose-6-phosphate isomerase [Gammaproteobacteria bacterium]MBT5223140.1 mannose-1-phosphate guanylyltransferase/mannose-6-phosphate isomerase [Gammaproteobacteria bacterium]MBT5825015.1 mannose-1-phosphate guanylyltransferase/mannose-6-phosphate isomerase [Gammaproteobacteria bacterium]MBT5965996.1 mannose-1-phosphate guanylyltransferase/
MMIPVILSGGSGTRLWPLSRGIYPKQFLPLVSESTMVQETVLRLAGLERLQAPIAICNEDHRFMMAEQLREINAQAEVIILEPVGKNTAPAVALAALAAKNLDDILLVLPADHVIENIPAFQRAVVNAGQLAEQDYLVTFGIVPTAAETGYGYIKRSSEKIDHAFKVAEFVEKPDVEVAEAYVSSGEYYWNSGMFAFKAGRYLEELEKFSPEILEACRLSFAGAQSDVDFVRLNKDAFSQCPSDSIDYAVMEKTDKAVVIPLDADWSDVGSWSALWEVREKDSFGNALTGDVVAIDTKNSFIHSGNKLVAAVGVQDMIIIETDDAVMIAPKDRVQEVKKIVAVLKNDQRAEADLHRKVYRPWGYYDSVDNGDRHTTKRIVVNPGAKLSVQKHHHRSEHWVIVKGSAVVIKGDETMLLSENESTYIPLGVIHSLENPGVIPLEIIEVQTGSYLGEDDIVRFEDKYGRT